MLSSGPVATFSSGTVPEIFSISSALRFLSCFLFEKQPACIPDLPARYSFLYTGFHRETIIFGPMIRIQYPEPGFKIETRNGQPHIFDALRKKWLVLQDEEWIRQNFIQYLLQTMRYPAALIALEKEIRLGELKKRFDILVYDPDHHPWMLIECKADQVLLNDAVLNQVLRYNIALPAPYLVITNGNHTYGWKKETRSLTPIETLPEFFTHY
ncbi:Type I restriction enzyme R protein N terminus (HSDR_N) [Niabella drilacis]|uniref:Type I restriction enzyme R protein N terminus (HSDR_N) n=2 Tax=Niabella drilacis (strain DSM 25811 / CCM 8410 / CCUG 62505 / LMG 26954 / E90) TaxID=1285928 RepID=A0A1G6SNL0_NIADE|nr:Type I restriction enzyme R protein N terminus (HSDR_N) [Niabella drilacis]